MCSEPHWLYLSRQDDTHWGIGYMNMTNGGLIQGLAIDKSDTIHEASERMYHAVQRFEKRGRNQEGHDNGTTTLV